MDDLPEDIIEKEILLRLPNKSIICLSSVCKSWRSRILNPYFINFHMMNSVTNLNNQSFIAHNKMHLDHHLYVINMNFLGRAINLNLPSSLPRTTSAGYDYFTVVGSCNGLFCLAYKCTQLQKRLYLWNPVTRQVKEISKYKIIIHGNLGDHSVSFGFGFDIAGSDYKVVRIVSDNRRFISRVEVYSLNENSWKEIKVEFKFKVFHSFCPPVVKGLFYWFVAFSHQPDRALVSFDVHNEKFCTIPLPDGNKCYNIFEFKQSVALTEKLDNRGFSIRILDDDSRWIEKFTITLPLGIKDIVGCLKTGEFAGQSICADELCLYDSVSNVVKHTCLYAFIRNYNYSESLLNLNHPNGITLRKKR